MYRSVAVAYDLNGARVMGIGSYSVSYLDAYATYYADWITDEPNEEPAKDHLP